MAKFYQSIITIALGFCLILSQCSVFSEPPASTTDMIQNGWDLFEEGKYELALRQFTDAVYKNPNNEGGYHGKGWCYLLLNQPVNAIDNFYQAISRGNQTLDPVAGLAAAFLANANYADAIIKGETVLAANVNYYFEHEPMINFQDIRLILAMAYYHEGRLSDAQQQVNFLDPTNTLNAADPSSWVVDQKTYNSYAEALMALIDQLDVLYGM